MPSINSPAFSQSFPNKGPTMREFNVGDPGNNDPQPQPYVMSNEEREEYLKLRQEKMARGDGLGEHAKKRIEILANIGRLTKDINIEGINFSLRTLKTKELREATMSVFKCANDIDAHFELRRNSLARSLFMIDGQDIELALGGKGLDLKLKLIDDMEEVIINKLYNEFNKLKSEVDAKYGVSNEQQVKEVLEDIKK